MEEKQDAHSDDPAEAHSDDPAEEDTEYPFNQYWTWCYYSPEMIHLRMEEIYQVGSVKDFWQLYNNIREPNDMLFRDKYIVASEDKMSDTFTYGTNRSLIETIIYKPLDMSNVWEILILSIMGTDMDMYDAVLSVELEAHRDFYQLVVELRPDNPETFIMEYSRLMCNNLSNIRYTSEYIIEKMNRL